MIDRSIMRIAAAAILLGSLSEASLAGVMSDPSCSAPEGNASASRRGCLVGATLDVSRGPRLCIGETARFRSRAAPFAAVSMLNRAHQNVCLKENVSVPLWHLAFQAQP